MTVTTDEQIVRNPLTSEQVDVSECICSFVNTTRLEILQSLDGQPRTPSMIRTAGEFSRQTVSKHLTHLSEYGLTKPGSEQGSYALTAGGALALSAFEQCFESIHREQLVALTRSTHALPVLRTLRTGPARPSELMDASTKGPSRATVQRTLELFDSAGWTSYGRGMHSVTSAGIQAIDAYDELAVTIEQVIAKAPWLQRLDPLPIAIPVRALVDAKVVVSSPDSPGIVLGAALGLCDPRLSRFRALTSIFNPTLFRAYDTLLKLGLAGEAIVDHSVYTHLHEEGLEHFLDDSEYEHFQIGHLEESLTLGIGLYDDRKVAIGAYNETGEGDHIAMLLSSNDALVEWGSDLYETYRATAFSTAEQANLDEK